MTLCADGKRQVTLKQPIFYKSSRDYIGFWSFHWWLNKVIDDATSQVAKLYKELHFNREKYYAVIDAHPDKVLVNFLPNVSNVINMSTELSKMRKVYEPQYNELMKPFEEFAVTEKFQLLRKGYVELDSDEAWNQAKADEIVDELDQLYLDYRAALCKMMIDCSVKGVPNGVRIAEEIHCVAHDLGLY